MNNPLYRAWKRVEAERPSKRDMWRTEAWVEWIIEHGKARDRYTHSHSWAVPSPQALRMIARYAPIVEVGAGTGYWAHMLRERGVDILAFDLNPPDKELRRNGYHPHVLPWTRVEQAPASVVKRYRERTLFLCWPPYQKKMAETALRNYRGRYIIYVGEEYGCNATTEFFHRLRDQFTEIETLAIPQWDGIHDGLWVYERNKYLK